MTPSAIRVVLADDHGVVRRGIRDFLTESGDIIVIAEAETGAQAFDYVIQHRPDVAVLDIQMPDGSGIEITRRLRSEGLILGVLILTAFDDPPYVKAAVEAGANGYLLKSADADELVSAVHAVHEGKKAFDAALTVQRLDNNASNQPIAKLSERERDILALAAQGLTNKAIGFQLSISDRTVQGHLANIYDRLGVSGRTEAVTRGVALGLIAMPSS